MKRVVALWRKPSRGRTLLFNLCFGHSAFLDSLPDESTRLRRNRPLVGSQILYLLEELGAPSDELLSRWPLGDIQST